MVQNAPGGMQTSKFTICANQMNGARVRWMWSIWRLACAPRVTVVHLCTGAWWVIRAAGYASRAASSLMSQWGPGPEITRTLPMVLARPDTSAARVFATVWDSVSNGSSTFNVDRVRGSD